MRPIPKSISTDSRNSSGPSVGFRTRLKDARLSGTLRRTWLSNVVFPVPASPVRATKPFLSDIAYTRAEIPSRCAGVKKRKLGSGVMPNGFFSRPKKDSYMLPHPPIEIDTGQARSKQRDRRDDGPFPLAGLRERTGTGLDVRYPSQHGHSFRQLPFAQYGVLLCLHGDRESERQSQTEGAAYPYELRSLRAYGL